MSDEPDEDYAATELIRRRVGDSPGYAIAWALLRLADEVADLNADLSASLIAIADATGDELKALGGAVRHLADKEKP